MEHRHGREGGCWARSRRRHEAGGKGYAGGKGEIRRGEDASHLAISKCFSRAKLMLLPYPLILLGRSLILSTLVLSAEGHF